MRKQWVLSAMVEHSCARARERACVYCARVCLCVLRVYGAWHADVCVLRAYGGVACV